MKGRGQGWKGESQRHRMSSYGISTTGQEGRLHGLAVKEGITPLDVDRRELLKGMYIEKKHTDDPMVAMQIALDHLAEHDHYYSEVLIDHEELEASGLMDTIISSLIPVIVDKTWSTDTKASGIPKYNEQEYEHDLKKLEQITFEEGRKISKSHYPKSEYDLFEERLIRKYGRDGFMDMRREMYKRNFGG